MRCKICNRFVLLSKECKNCADERQLKWDKAHRFTYLELVLVHADDSFYGRALKGEVLSKDVVGFGIPTLYTKISYTVRLEDGRIEEFYAEKLEKLK